MWIEADPRPAFCAACHNSTPEKYFKPDSNVMFDAGAFVNKDDLSYVEGTDELVLCDVCVREATEAADIKPQTREVLERAARLERDAKQYWKDYAQRLEATLQDRPEPVSRPRGRPLKAPVAA